MIGQHFTLGQRADWRYLIRYPWHLSLSVLGVAMGVAVVLAVDLASESAMRAFKHSSQAITGKATHQIIGGPQGIDEKIYRMLRVEVGLRQAAPIVSGYVTLLSSSNEPLQELKLLGVDIFAERPFRDHLQDREIENKIGKLLAQPASVVLPRNSATQYGISIGDKFLISVGGKAYEVTLAGIFTPRDALERNAVDSVVISDIATAQELLGMLGYLSHIDLIVPTDGRREKFLQRIQTILPQELVITTASARQHTLEQMTRAFRLNLTALSLLALFVGMFLIYNTMIFLVLRRRHLTGMLRVLGMTHIEICKQILMQATVIGILGTLLGIALGIILAKHLLFQVTQTINDLYFVLNVSELDITSGVLFKGVAIGLGATLLASLIPAYEATNIPPHNLMHRSFIEVRVQSVIPRSVYGGVALWLVGGLLLLIPGHELEIGFIALFIFIVGFALLIPGLTLISVRFLQPLMKRMFGVLGSMAVRSIRVSLSRTGIAIACLTVAISTTIGVGIMIDSFRISVANWLDNYLRADVFISSAGRGNGLASGRIKPELVQRLANAEGVAHVSVGRRVQLFSDKGATELFALQIPKQSFSAFRLKEGDPETAIRAFFHKGAVIISEPYAYHHNVGVGDAVRLHTDTGEREFQVVGIYYDYGSDQGVVTMSRNTYEYYWKDRNITSLGIYFENKADIQTKIKYLRGIVAGDQALIFRSNFGLRQASLAIFDRTFAITQVLRLLAIIVAFIGIFSALMAIQLERTKELAVLRAIGLTPSQLWRLIGSETGLMGLIAGVFAMPLGIAMSLVLILVINRRSFGWSMEISIDPGILINALVLAVAAALLAGIYPALRMQRTSLAFALREE